MVENIQSISWTIKINDEDKNLTVLNFKCHNKNKFIVIYNGKIINTISDQDKQLNQKYTKDDKCYYSRKNDYKDDKISVLEYGFSYTLPTLEIDMWHPNDS